MIVEQECDEQVHERYRLETDLIGEARVPKEAYYGIQTQRAMNNFNVTGIGINHFAELICSLAMVKQASVRANLDLQLISKERACAIDQACQDIIDGKLHDQFCVDLIQGGAGTSTNMNANEVIANRALELLGFAKGTYDHLHPNDHVNLSQSTNDVYPTAARLAIVFSVNPLLEVVQNLRQSLDRKAEQFKDVVKVGRTQLQDAVPMTLGQEFRAFSVTLFEDMERFQEVSKLLLEVNLGGTAIGTGLNTHRDYSGLAIEHLSNISGKQVVSALCKVEATSDMGAFLSFSSVLKRLAVKLSKIANDLRLLSSGPRAGFNEINLPAVQPGSSMMPGKVNPVIPEAMNQTAFQVMSNDLAVTLAAEAGQLQLNAMEPLIIYNILQSVLMLSRAVKMFDERCIQGITANEAYCNDLVKNSIGLITALNSKIGYKNTSRIAKEALSSGRSITDLLIEEAVIEEGDLKALLDFGQMTMDKD